MKIYGIGTDIVEIDRIKKLIKNKNLLKRLFDPQEIIKCLKVKNSSNCFAKDLLPKRLFLRH